MTARALALLVAVAACARAPVPVARDAVEPQAARAEQAFGALKARLMTRLATAMGEGGPAVAIDVCSTEAQAMTAEIGRGYGLALGRTSFRLRNAQNAPRAWAANTVNAGEGLEPSAVRPAWFELGDRVGVLAPIPMGAMCESCHGRSLAPEVAQALEVRYPQDRATGFSEGELRGFFWAEVPKG